MCSSPLNRQNNHGASMNSAAHPKQKDQGAQIEHQQPRQCSKLPKISEEQLLCCQKNNLPSPCLPIQGIKQLRERSGRLRLRAFQRAQGHCKQAINRCQQDVIGVQLLEIIPPLFIQASHLHSKQYKLLLPLYVQCPFSLLFYACT